MAAQDQELNPIHPFQDFREAASTVLQLLQERIGMGLWLVTRTEGEDWIVLNAEDRGYEVHAGDVFRWSDSFCSRMVQGLGPRIAPNSEDVPEYASAPIAQQIPIGSYVGVPITKRDGSLFGTLCAVDPEPQAETLHDHLPSIEIYSRLLATILNNELDIQDQARKTEHAEAESERDPLTGVFNRRGWKRLREAEEGRCKRYGLSSAIVIIDLDGLKDVNDTHGHSAGDELLRTTADILLHAVRASDIVARLGGDEFAVLAVEETADGLGHLTSRLESALAEASIEASVGGAVRDPRSSLRATQAQADGEMYRQKRAKRRG